MTKIEMFKSIREAVSTNSEMVAFIDHEIELLSKKASTPRKPTKTQIENESFKSAIVEYLSTADVPKTIKDMQAEVEGFDTLSNQRISHMLTDLRKAGIVARTYVKKVAYFALGKEEGVEEEG